MADLWIPPRGTPFDRLPDGRKRWLLPNGAPHDAMITEWWEPPGPPAALTVDVRESKGGKRVDYVDTFRLTAKQATFWRACDERWPVREVMIDGAIRSGKTQVAMKRLVDDAWRYPRSMWIVMRSTYNELEDSTKKILLDGVEMPPVLPPQLIAQRWDGREKNQVLLRNGSWILFRSLEPEHRGKIRNATYAGMLIDQAEEMEGEEFEEYYGELLGRISDPRTPRKMVLVANPGPATHWLCRRFGATPEADIDRGDRLREQTRRIHVTVIDNRHNLHPQYFWDLMATEETRPAYFKQMVLGQWGSFGGNRFKFWRPELHLVSAASLPVIPSEWEFIEGIDWGHSHPTVCIHFGIDLQGAWWGLLEHREKEQTVEWHAQRILANRRNDATSKHNPPEWLPPPMQGDMEPSMTALSHDAFNRTRKEISTVADSFREHGINPVRAQNERKGGWNRIDEMLARIMPDGKAQLRFVAETCPGVIRELPNLKVDPKTDDVVKEYDDGPDACRYGIMTRMPHPVEKQLPQPKDMSRKAVAQRLHERATRAADGRNVITTV